MARRLEGRAVDDAVKAGLITIEEATQAIQNSFARLLGVPDPAAPGAAIGLSGPERREAPGVLRQAARPRFVLKRILPNGPWLALSLMVAGFPAGGPAIVFAAGAVSG